jgi:hypothetical protein
MGRNIHEDSEEEGSSNEKGKGGKEEAKSCELAKIIKKKRGISCLICLHVSQKFSLYHIKLLLYDLQDFVYLLVSNFNKSVLARYLALISCPFCWIN